MGKNTITLGVLIEQLRVLHEPDAPVQFDFGNLVPAGFASYRGYYEDAAIGYVDLDKEPQAALPSVETFTKELESRIGTIIHGYKGGENVVRNGTYVWVSNYSYVSCTAIVKVDMQPGGIVVIHTAYED